MKLLELLSVFLIVFILSLLAGLPLVRVITQTKSKIIEIGYKHNARIYNAAENIEFQ